VPRVPQIDGREVLWLLQRHGYIPSETTLTLAAGSVVESTAPTGMERFAVVARGRITLPGIADALGPWTTAIFAPGEAMTWSPVDDETKVFMTELRLPAQLRTELSDLTGSV